jgi:hypothetical protein
LQQVYDERNRLVALAVVLACEAGYRVGLLDDADEPDWPVLAIELPTGQVAWPVPQDVANLLSEVEEVEVTRFVCDGHDGAAQAQRIERFIQSRPQRRTARAARRPWMSWPSRWPPMPLRWSG